MMHRKHSSLLILAFSVIFAAPVVAQDFNQEGFGVAALFVISHPAATAEEDGRRVRAMISIVAPKHPLPARNTWRILPGTVYPSHLRPRGEVKVKLYTGVGANKQLLCAIDVRYFRNRRNQWQPHYRLNEDSTIIWRGSVWGSLNPVADETNLLFLISTRTPNGQGFYSYLDLRSSVGPVTINSWIVGRGLN